MRKPERITIVILVAACALQTYVLASGYGLSWVKATWRTRAMPSMDRAARFLLGNGESRYMRFLASIIPRDAAVVIPQGAGEFSEQNILQFFLMPRAIAGCPCQGLTSASSSAPCLSCLRKAEHYVPAISQFPPPATMLSYKEFIPYPRDTGWFHGVYVQPGAPRPHEAGETSLQPPGPPIGLAVVLDLAIWAAIAVVGTSLARCITDKVDWVDAALLAIPLGTGLLTWGVFLTAWLVGGEVNLAHYAAILAALGIGAIVWGRRAKRLDLPSRAVLLRVVQRSADKGRLPSSLVVMTSGLVVFVAAVISIGRSYSIYDDIANWALKGYAIADFGTIFAGNSWGGHGLAYPQNMHLAIALFRMVDADTLPGSKLLFPLFFASMAGACLRSWRRANVSVTIAALATLILVTMPVLFVYSTTGYANIPFAVYLVLGLLWTKSGLDENSLRTVELGMLLMALAAWTRPEGIGFAISSLALLLACSSKRSVFLRAPAAPLAVFASVTGPWVAFGTRYQIGDEIGEVVRVFLLSRHVDFASLTTLARHGWRAFWAINSWGVLIPVLIVLVVIAAFRPQEKGRVHHSELMPIVVLLVAIPLGMFYAKSYSTSAFELFLDVSFDRAMFPAGILALWIAVAVAAGRRCEDDQGAGEISPPRGGIE